MRKILLSLMLCLFVTGLQAQKVSFDFSTNSWGLPVASANKTVEQATFTSNDYSVVLTGSEGNGYYFNEDGYLMLGKKGATLALPAFDFAVSEIEVVGRTGASAKTVENVYVGETAVSTACTGSAATNVFAIDAEYQAAGNVYVFTIESNHNAQIVSINVYEADSEGGEIVPDDPDVESSTISEVLNAGEGDAKTSGTVVATYARGFLLGDETGNILVYLGADSGLQIGDKVTVSGSTGVYGGLLQFGSASVVEKIGSGEYVQPEPVVMSASDMDSYLAAPYIKYVQYTGTLTISGYYYNVAIDGAETAMGSISYVPDGLVSESLNGSVVTVTGYVIGVSGSKYVSTMAVSVTGEGGEIVPDDPDVPVTGDNLLANSDLEIWSDGVPDDWAAVVTNCTYEQSGDARSGGSSVLVKGASSNKRFASKSYVLKAGTYSLSAFLKQVPDSAAGSFRLGYAKLTNGAVAGNSDYIYITDPATVSAEWSEVSATFTLTETTELSIIIMNSKVGNGAPILVDDITLKTNDGGIDEGGAVELETAAFTLVTDYDGLKDGKIVIAAGDVAMGSLSGNYGYVPSRNVTVDGNVLVSVLEAAYTLEAYDDGYIIKDANGKYLHLTGTYNSFNVSEELPTEGAVWYIDFDAEGALVINNAEKNKDIKLSGTYGNFGAYAADYDGEDTFTMPKLYVFSETVDTAIDAVQIDDAVVKGIYDITGRRIEEITAPGIYIVDGRKVIVK